MKYFSLHHKYLGVLNVMFLVSSQITWSIKCHVPRFITNNIRNKIKTNLNKVTTSFFYVTQNNVMTTIKYSQQMLNIR